MARVRLISAAAIAALVTVAAPALADGGGAIVTGPANWHLDREKSAQMNAAAERARVTGPAAPTDVTEAYFPSEIGVALVVTRSTMDAHAEARDFIIGPAVADFEAWPAREAAIHAPITDQTHARAVLADAKLLEITVGGRDASAQTRSMYRMIVAADAGKVVTVTGLCLERDDANPAHVAACRASLATLDTGIAPAGRVALEMPAEAPAATGVGSTGTDPGSAGIGAGSAGAGSSAAGTIAPTLDPSFATTPGRAAPSITDGVHLPPIDLREPAPASDRRPVYLGLGIVLLAGVFWWNRRRRERYQPAASKPHDADDLHAAAADDAEPKKDNTGA